MRGDSPLAERMNPNVSRFYFMEGAGDDDETNAVAFVAHSSSILQSTFYKNVAFFKMA